MAVAIPAAPDDVSALFARADYIKTIDNPTYIKLIAQLNNKSSQLNEAEKWHLRYLEAWQAAYVGRNDKAKTMLETVIEQAPDDALKMQAKGTLINILGIGHHYEEAFTYLDHALDDLPKIADKSIRIHILAEASQLLMEAGQYDLALGYADQILSNYPDGHDGCIGMLIRIHAEFLSGRVNMLTQHSQQGINRCEETGDKLGADTIRRDIASLDLQKNKVSEAMELLQSHYAEVLNLQYRDLISEYNVLIAEAYWRMGDPSQAEKYAAIAADIASKSNFTEPMIRAYQLLYQVARQNNNLPEALNYHEKYVAADNGHLDDVREKALAYQIVKQQVEAKKIELSELNRQNQILELQRALDHKAMVTSRLYIALLLTILASIALWLYRLKRSQLRFMQLARRDGLTGIFNRQHFVEEAEQALRYAAKSLRGACLILIDLDHFKNVNDTHGHVAGDHALKRTVSICQKHLHSSDVFGRIGGEEFGILLPECTLIQALERAESIRQAIQATPEDDTEGVPLTASFGVATTSHYGYDLRRMLVAADSALYRAKRDGRNRVVVSMQDHEPSPFPANQRTHGDKRASDSPCVDSTE